jgi:thiol:disulfide interchange protein DsbD
MPIRLGLISTVMVLATASAWVRPAETDHLKVQLISDTDSVQPGRPLLVGLHFEMQKQWHIYWRNPGDSGEPPRVRWKLPAGFQAGEVQWPAPERLGSGTVIDYGYQESVLLPVEIQTPRTPLAPGGSITLSAEVSWLVCRDMCVPGKADLTLSLPVRMAPGPVSASHTLFQEAGSRLPKPMPPAWRTEATSEKEFFVLTIQGAGVAKASFFPLEADQIDNASPQTTTSLPGGVQLTLKKSDQLSKTPARLDGVLKLSSGRVYAVSAPVRSLPERSAQQ